MQASSKARLIIILGTVLALLSALFMACFGAIFTALVNNMLVINPNNAIFDTFESPSVPIYMDFYMFNVTNPEEVQHYGATPILVELGPYRYREVMEKYGYIWNSNDGTVTYRQNTTYFFEPSMSYGLESDNITTLNAVMVLLGAMTYENKLVNEIIWPEIEEGMDLFETFTVSELLFEGWDLPMFNFDLSIIPGLGFTENLTGDIYEILLQLGIDVPYFEENKIGLYRGVNGTDDGEYKVKTGELGMDDYLYIQTWNNDTEIHYWGTDYCNMINGTDGTQYPPGVNKDQTLRMFTTDLCRSLYMDYEYDVKVQDIIDTYHYVPPPSMLESPNTNEDNMCYCILLPGSDDCLDDSMLNMEPCLGAPIVLSTPHFYQGQQEDIDKVEGLSPEKDLHETYLDIEPTTGVIMEAAKRIQLNLPLRKYGKLPAFQNVPELIFPVFWASENAQIGEDDAKALNKVLTLPYLIVYVICGIIIFVGLTMVLIGGIRHRKARRHASRGKLLM